MFKAFRVVNNMGIPSRKFLYSQFFFPLSIKVSLETKHRE